MNPKKPPVSRYTLRVVQPNDEAALHAAMRRWPPARHSSSDLSIAVRHQLARVLTIWRLLRASLRLAPCLTGMMLAASSGLSGRSARKLTRLLTGSDSLRAFIRLHRRCSARAKGDEP